MIDLRFTQSWPNTLSPISLLFGGVDTPQPKNNIGIFVSLAWQSNEHIGTQKKLSWKGKSAEQHVVLASRSILVEQYKRRVSTSSNDVLNQVQLCFKTSLLENNSTVINWRNGTIKTRTVTIVFSHNELLKKLLTSSWLARQQQKEVTYKLSWSGLNNVSELNEFSWQSLKDVTASNFVASYGISPSRVICHFKNHPKAGLVMLSFDNDTVEVSTPLVLTFKPREKNMCAWKSWRFNSRQ